jgi:phage-related holin
MWETLFGPLDRKYCTYFLFLSIISFVLMLISAGNLLFMLVESKKNWYHITQTFNALLMLGISYFSNRLLNTMCVR